MSEPSRGRCKRDGCDERVVGRRLCRKHYQRAWKAGEFENAPLHPRQPGQTVCPPEHKHDGSSTCYIQHQCRCVPCKEHHSAMETKRSRARAYGLDYTGLVDAEPIREHMMMLAEFGIGYKRAAALAGIGTTAARTLIWGRQDPGPRNGELQKRVKRETAMKLLSVKPDLVNLAGGARIPARGTHRRVQALVSRGWSQSKLSEMVDRERGNFGTMMSAEYVSVKFHLQIAELYERLWNELPPHDEWRDKIAYTRSLTFAKQRRWLPPLAWDDIDNDVEPPLPDEEVGIDEMAVQLALSGERVRLTSLERRVAITELVTVARLSDTAIAERIHVTNRTVLRIRQELALPAVVGPDKQIVMAS